MVHGTRDRGSNSLGARTKFPAAMALSEALRTELDAFDQGQRRAPLHEGYARPAWCGFSAAVTAALDELIDDYRTINVLERPEIHGGGIKEYSSWPTIPSSTCEATSWAAPTSSSSWWPKESWPASSA